MIRDWKWFARTIGRPILFGIGVLVVLGVVYGPNTQTLNGAGDVYLYQDYARQLIQDPPQLPREYPPLSALLFVVPQLFLPERYMLGWALWATLAIWLTVVAVDRINNGGWWMLALVSLGAWGTAAFRFDIFIVLVTTLAFGAAKRQRWVLAQLLLALGVALKLYPLILMPLVVIWQWRTTRRLPLTSALGGAAGLLAAVGGMWAIDPAQLAGVLAYHGQRPLEIESIGASIGWLRGPRDAVSVDFSFGSFNLFTPSDALLIPLLSGLTIVLLLLLYGWFSLDRIGPATAWALTMLISIATSKVFSTQYLLWPLPFVVLAATEFRHRGWRWTHYSIWLLIATLTGAVYPWGFNKSYAIFETNVMPPWLMTGITLRNVLWIVACVVLLRAYAVRGEQTVADPSVSKQPTSPRSSLST